MMRVFLHLKVMRLRTVRLFIWILAACVSAGAAQTAAAQGDAATIQRQIDAASPGSVIDLPDGTVQLDAPLRIKAVGTEEKPITIRARNRGKTTIAGKAGFELTGASHVLIEGFTFTHDNIHPAVRLVDCSHVRVSRNVFRLTGTTSPRQNWIHITGGKSGQNRIDRNLFEDLATPGAFIAIDGSEQAPYQISKGDHIEYNHFRNIPKKAGGARALRLGWTKLAGSTGQTIVEFNLFDACLGDDELISVRSSGQIIRYNTFLNCNGCVTLRAGNDNSLEGNFFFGENKPGTAGVRLHGSGAKVFNNYFEGMALPALILSNGQNKPANGEVPRPAPTKSTIVFNTWVNCLGGALEIGADNGGAWPDAPTECVAANNIVIGYGDELIRVKGKADGVKWAGNIMYHAVAKEKVGVAVSNAEILVTFPKLRLEGGIWRLATGSPAIDAAAEGEYDFVITDIDGQPRSKKKDVGSDEANPIIVKHKPLTGMDVGVEAQ